MHLTGDGELGRAHINRNIGGEKARAWCPPPLPCGHATDDNAAMRQEKPPCFSPFHLLKTKAYTGQCHHKGHQAFPFFFRFATGHRVENQAFSILAYTEATPVCTWRTSRNNEHMWTKKLRQAGVAQYKQWYTRGHLQKYAKGHASPRYPAPCSTSFQISLPLNLQL